MPSGSRNFDKVWPMIPRSLTVCVTLLCLSGATQAREPWADPSLPPVDGLLLWLDAARQPAAWQALGRPSLGDGSALDAWYDGSGNGWDMRQRIREAQPK